MDAMEAQLRQTYAAWDTEELVHRAAKGGLTETAERLLAEELARRAVSPAAVAVARARVADVARRGQAFKGRLAPIPARAIAAAIDHLGIMGIFVAVNFAVFVVESGEIYELLTRTSLFAWLAYALFKDGFNGQSLGKRLLRIQVVDKDNGTPCTLPKSLLRGVVGLLGLIDLLFMLSADRQRLADHAANTVVLKK